MAVVPTIPYREVFAMADWLCEAFGFQKQLVVKGESGEFKHAQLAFGDSMIMVYPVQDFASEKLVVHPDQVGGVGTQTCYLVVADVEEHYARAKAKGAEIIFGIRAGNCGGRGYASRDPEGHVWMFGTYDPQQDRSLATSDGPRRQRPSPRVYLLTLALSTLTLASAGAAFWTYSAIHGTMLSLHRITEASGAPPSAEAIAQFAQEERGARRAAEAKLIEARAAKESAEQKATELIARLARESAARESAEQGGKEARQLLAQELRTRESLARAAKHAEDELGQARIAKAAAEKVTKDAIDQLDRARLGVAERISKETTEKCEQERVSRSLAERSAKDAIDRLMRERSARAAAELAANELRNQLVTFGTDPQLRDQIEAARRARGTMESAAKDAQLQLAQEKYSRDATERALKQAQQQLAAKQASCWACPSAAPCARQ